MDSIAVANPCFQNEWEEWKRGMEDDQRRWRDRVRCWVEEGEGEGHEGGKEDTEEEEEGKESSDVRGSREDDEEEEVQGCENNKNMKEEEESEDEEENNKVQKGAREDKTMEEPISEVEQIDLVKTEEKVTEKEQEQQITSQEVVEEEKEEEEIDEERGNVEDSDAEEKGCEKDEKVKEKEEIEDKTEHNAIKRRIREEESISEVDEEIDLEEEEEEMEVKEKEEVEMEKEEEEVQFLPVKEEDEPCREKEGKYEDKREEEEDDVSDEMLEESVQHEVESETTVEMDEPPNSEEHQEQNQPTLQHQVEQFSDLTTGREDENIQRNLDGEDKEDADFKELKSMEFVETFQTTHEERIQDNETNVQEEFRDSTDEEEAAEESNNEDEDCEDEDMMKIYSTDQYPTDIFQTLSEFRESSLFTDLTLITETGACHQVHSVVLAAVSAVVLGRLTEGTRPDNDDTSVGVLMWSMCLGPEVDHVGLGAVVEFAYTGLMTSLNEETVDRIRTAAQTLGAPRVLELCSQENFLKTGGQKNSAEHKLINLQSIRQLWMDGVGCDVNLKALGKSLHVHRVVLAASSDYFRGMFTSGMRECFESRVTLPFLMAPELEVLISCSYSGVLPLGWKCVFETTSSALQLQHQPALSLCLRFLQEEMNPYYCLDVASFAEAYEIVELLEVADDFVLRQFQKVARTSKFRDLPARQLLRYLNSPALCVPSELVVFKAVVAWIQAKPKRRIKLAQELMKTIHFPLMTFKEFKEVKSLKIWSDHNLADLYDAVFQDFCSSEIIPQTQCRIYLPKESLVLIGGDQISEDLGSRSISRELWFGNSLRNHTGIRKAMEWRKLGEMPEPARFSHEVAVLKGQLYVFGGKKYYGISDTLNSVYRYDPLQNQWEKLVEMQENRCSFSVVVLDDRIHALGGYCDPECIDSVEQYSPTANSWSFTWPLDLPLSGHVAKVLQGKIFVSGGHSSDHQCLASLFLYHPETGSSRMANMMTPRAHHCMEAVGERLYVAGGITTDDNTAVADQLTCEVYSPAADSWTVFAPLPVPHVGAASAVLEGKFYVLGGYSQEDYTDTKMVHRYDPSLQRWENMGKMPGPNNDIRAALLCLPTHLRL